MGFDFRAIRYLLRLNLSIKKHDLVKSRVFYEVSCASSGALPEELQKQVFNFLVALELAQVWRKPFSVKAQLFRQRQLPAPQLLQQVRQYLHEQYAQKLTLDVLSARYNISKYHLQRSFQHYFGQSPGEYLTQLRLTRAKELLRATCRSPRSPTASAWRTPATLSTPSAPMREQHRASTGNAGQRLTKPHRHSRSRNAVCERLRTSGFYCPAKDLRQRSKRFAAAQKALASLHPVVYSSDEARGASLYEI